MQNKLFASENIYLKLPISLQNLACSIAGQKIKRSRYGKAFRQALHEFETRLHWNHDQLVKYRDQQLRYFVKHAYLHVPYYREQFSSLNIVPADIRSLSDLKVLPVINKQIVKENMSAFISAGIHPKDKLTAHTSGTTGSGLFFEKTVEAELKQWAVWWRFRRAHGIQLDTWCAYFSGRPLVPVQQKKPPFWRYNVPGHQIMFSIFHMCEANMKAYVDILNKRQPPWFHGYPSALSQLANYILDSGHKLNYSPSWVSIGAENLLSSQVESMTLAFGVSPIQHYGLAEGVANISQQPNKELSIDYDFAAVEFIEETNSDGLRIVGTNFTNYATPLIRYDTGDIAKVITVSGQQKVVSIDGRSEDYVTLSDGRKVGRLDHVFKDARNVTEAQIFQPNVDTVVVRVVKGQLFNKSDEEEIESQLRLRLGNKLDIQFHYCNFIPKTSSGKLKFVVSNI